MNLNSINLAVPAEQQSDVAQWQDGETYTITVKQTAPGQLELVSTQADDESTEADETGAAPDMSKSDNPAIAIVMSKKGMK